jgi:hypothetical protein
MAESEEPNKLTLLSPPWYGILHAATHVQRREAQSEQRKDEGRSLGRRETNFGGYCYG